MLFTNIRHPRVYNSPLTVFDTPTILCCTLTVYTLFIVPITYNNVLSTPPRLFTYKIIFSINCLCSQIYRHFILITIATVPPPPPFCNNDTNFFSHSPLPPPPPLPISPEGLLNVRTLPALLHVSLSLTHLQCFFYH